MAMHDASQLRILVAGAGGFGREHLDRLAGRGDVRLAGIADPDPAALAFAAGRYNIKSCFSDPLRLIDETPADALIVATPLASHAEITTRALARNLCVLLEKPVGGTAAIVAQLIDAADASNAFVLPGHVLRFSTDHARVVEVVRSGKIGQVGYVNSRRYRDDSHARRYADVDPVLMTMIHDIDLALWVAGSPFRSVSAWRSAGAGFRSITAASASTMSGVRCELRTAWIFDDGELPPDRLEVVGDLGSVELVVGKSLHIHAAGRLTETPAASGDDALHNEQEHFLACVSDRQREPALWLRDALAGLKLADAIMESLRHGHEVTIAA